MIQFSNIQFIREERHILKDVSFTMSSGEHWVILGKNGSGKTTLLELMNGYLFPSSGEVRVLGNLYGRCDVREVRKQIGYISQSLIEKLVLRDPVWEVVATGEYAFLRFYEAIDPQVVEKAWSQLEMLHIAHLGNQSFGQLSQGERKKVLMARVLMTAPRILIMDEPCSGLDLYEREQLLSELQGLEERGMQLVYVTHHTEEIMPMFTHVLFIEEGQVLASGDKRDVVTRERMEQAYRVPVDVEWANDRPWVKVRASW